MKQKDFFPAANIRNSLKKVPKNRILVFLILSSLVKKKNTQKTSREIPNNLLYFQFRVLTVGQILPAHTILL